MENCDWIWNSLRENGKPYILSCQYFVNLHHRERESYCIIRHSIFNATLVTLNPLYSLAHSDGIHQRQRERVCERGCSINALYMYTFNNFTLLFNAKHIFSFINKFFLNFWFLSFYIHLPKLKKNSFIFCYSKPSNFRKFTIKIFFTMIIFTSFQYNSQILITIPNRKILRKVIPFGISQEL